MNAQRVYGDMMFKVELHKEVIDFLESSGTVWVNGNERSYIVNNSWYKPTDKHGVYTLQFLEQTKSKHDRY